MNKKKSVLSIKLAALTLTLVGILTLMLSACVIELNSGTKETDRPPESETTETVKDTEATLPTEEPTTEPEVFLGAEFYAGTWQGSDDNVTTIIIREDGTLFYRELNNNKLKTVKGTNGTWAEIGGGHISISLPGLGNGYELDGAVQDDEGILLTCTNGQVWGDEIIRKSSITEAEIEATAEKKMNEIKGRLRKEEFGTIPWYYEPCVGVWSSGETTPLILVFYPNNTLKAYNLVNANHVLVAETTGRWNDRDFWQVGPERFYQEYVLPDMELFINDGISIGEEDYFYQIHGTYYASDSDKDGIYTIECNRDGSTKTLYRVALSLTEAEDILPH